MNRIEELKRIVVRLDKEIHELGTKISELTGENFKNDKKQKAIDEVIDNIDICEQFLTTYKQELLQKIYGKNKKLKSEIDR